ncbi:peptide deformylase, mitochondrial isoform X2 [Chelmon rostratus]|uniref:peptide deformylase, mitochondrial isoform X2 n=1 Tax=Chelmon rostratus TaxID=109905 RepID=UPI001BEB2BC0|nr:peptide deformylase, mitochondrial isoform X2 [Chelmon rostratus]
MNAKPCVSLLQLSRMGFRLCASKAPRCSAGALNLTSPYLPHISLHSPVPCSHPYSTNVKVGDPVLRSHASAVDPAAITGPEIQQVINTMVKVMRKVDSVGLSAPQIGVPLRILVLEYTERMLEESSPESRKARGLSVQPLRVFVNPQLRILDGQTVLFQEACESITGFSARVPRFLSVEVSGLNEKGEAVSWQASGWPARILQHEMDHLDGVLYIDRMDSKTFININWQAYNE